MPSRKQRKRYRRDMAEATACGLQSAGGWGGGVPIRRSDLLLIRQAIREGWDVPQKSRDDIVRDVTDILEDPASRPRMLNAAVWAVLAMEGENARLLFKALNAELQRG
jgi:hypothetical protein